MKITQRSQIQNQGVTKGKRPATTGKGDFRSIMDEQGVVHSTVEQEGHANRADEREQQRGRKEKPEVMLMLIRQGIDVLDDGLAQIEREGVIADGKTLRKIDELRGQLHGLRKRHGADPLLDDSETILNVESERIRQLA